MPFGRSLEDGLEGSAFDDSHSAGGAAMVVNGAALSGLPTEEEGVIARTFLDEVSSIVMVVEFDEIAHVFESEIEFAETFFKEEHGDVVFCELVEFAEQRLKVGG